MKRLALILLSIALIISITGCSVTKGSDSASSAPDSSDNIAQTNGASISKVPADLLSAEYNPFDEVEWPEGYTVYQMNYESGEYNLYRIYLTAEGSAEDVATFVSTLLGDDLEENIEQNIELLNEGWATIYGSQTDKGLNADAEIEPTDPDGDYEYVNGYTVTLVTLIAPEKVEDYSSILDANFNTEAIAFIDAADFLEENQPVNREIYVINKQGATQVKYCYSLNDDYETWKEFFTSSQFADNEDIRMREEDGTTFMNYDYGDMHIGIIIHDESRRIFIDQWIDNIQSCAADYTPVASGT